MQNQVYILCVMTRLNWKLKIIIEKDKQNVDSKTSKFEEKSIGDSNKDFSNDLEESTNENIEHFLVVNDKWNYIIFATNMYNLRNNIYVQKLYEQVLHNIVLILYNISKIYNYFLHNYFRNQGWKESTTYENLYWMSFLKEKEVFLYFQMVS